jgi:hypothetical protein
VRESAGSDESVTVRVNVDPGAGEGVRVEITNVVTVGSGLLTSLEGDRLGETELMSGGWEGEEMLVGGKTELGLLVNDLGVDERGGVEGVERVEGGTERVEEGPEGVEEGPEGVEEGSETIVLLDEDVGILVGLVEERRGMEDEDIELRLVMEEDGVTEGGSEDDTLELDGETVGLELVE